MHYFTNETIFNREMLIIQEIMEDKGFLTEADHPYTYSMQYKEAFNDVNDWLLEHGYNGTLTTASCFAPHAGAIEILYDSDRISYDDINKELIKEAKRQAEM